MLKKIILRFFYGHKAWQLSRETNAKFDLIKETLFKLDVNSILDIGCNAGELTRLAGNEGFFAVGIDKNIDFRGVKNPIENVCLGNMEINPDRIAKFPSFDAVLLLSVHHQLVKEYGDDYTKDFVNLLASKANKAFFIEFAALNSKFSDDKNDLFIDNNEGSVINYAENWLKSALPEHNIEYVGKTPGDKIEPYRFVFKCIV